MVSYWYGTDLIYLLRLSDPWKGRRHPSAESFAATLPKPVGMPRGSYKAQRL